MAAEPEQSAQNAAAAPAAQSAAPTDQPEASAAAPAAPPAVPADQPDASAAAPTAPRERVRVAVRVRPLTEGAKRATACAKNKLKLKTAHDEKTFKFDVVFDEASTQDRVYAHTAQKLVERVFDGRNATIMAYGQTGSGKTFTMGEPLDMLSSSGDGVIARALQDVFERCKALKDCTVGLSYLEVYNEAVYDLLALDEEPLTVREDASGSVVVPGLTESDVSNCGDAGRLLHRGALRRRTGATKMNDRSSRSHALLQVRVRRANGSVGKLVLVDLAGSERAARTQAQGQRLREGIEINKGLLALGNVVAALASNEEGKGTRRHAPFRDSKLTRLLKDSLGGTASTWVVACVSPRTDDAEETVNTLRYASRARSIANTAIRHNVGETPEQLLIAALRRENAELRAQLSGSNIEVKASNQDDLYEARRRQRCAEAALVAAKAEALAATMQADRARLSSGKDVDVVAQLREELAACRRQLASREPGAPAPDSAEAQQVAAITTLKAEEKRMGELRTQFAQAVQSLDAEVAFVWKSKFYGAFVLNHRVDLHAVDAAPARWRGDAGLDGASTAVSSPRNEHPTHWLISTQVAFLEQAREKAEKDLNDALSRKKTDDFSRRREEALRDALERRRRDLEAKRRELKSTKQEASRVEGLRRRAEAEASALRAKADVLRKQRVDAVNKLRSETSQRLQEKKTAAHELARAQRTGTKSQAEITRLKAQHAREAHVLRRRCDEAQARARRLPETKSSDLKHLAQRLDAHVQHAVEKSKAGASVQAYAPTSAADARLALKWYHDRLVKAELRAPPPVIETRAAAKEKVRPRGQILQPSRRQAHLFRPRQQVSSGSEFEASSSEEDEEEEEMQHVTRRRKKPPVLTGDGLDGLTVPQLKDKLRPLQLKLAGRKSELVARLRAHYASSDGSEALNALVDADAAVAPGFRVLAPPPVDAGAAPAAVLEEPVVPETTAAPPVPEATAPSAEPAAAPPVASEEPVAPEVATAPPVDAVASEEIVPEPPVDAASEEPSTADEAAEDTAKAARRAALAARRAAVAARRAAAAPSVDAAPAPPVPEAKRVPRLSSVLASISLATGAVAEAAAARAPRPPVVEDDASDELDYAGDDARPPPPPPPPQDEETGERVVAPACRRSWLASDGLSFAASGTAATRRLSAVSAAFPSPRLCQPAANVEPGPAKQLVPKRAGRKAFGVVNR